MTLTKVKPEVNDLIAIGIPEESFLSITSCFEKNYPHPLAEAVVRTAESRLVKIEPAKQFDTYGGKVVLQ
ncbi:MAG: hypothetical protein WCF90_00175 [Methanomicrobiales archaeon]